MIERVGAAKYTNNNSRQESVSRKLNNNSPSHLEKGMKNLPSMDELVKSKDRLDKKDSKTEKD